MTPRAPRYELTRVSDGNVEPPQIVPVAAVPLDTVMGRRGALGVGVGAAALLVAMQRLSGQSGRSAVTQPKAEPRAPYPQLNAHIKAVTALKLVPNSDLLASASADNAIKLWSLADGRLVRRLEGHTDDVKALACTPEGRILISASDDSTIRLWSIPDGKAETVLFGHQSAVTALAVAQDGRLLISASADGTVRLWSLPDGHLHGTIQLVQGRSVTQLAVSADGKTLYTSIQFDDTVASWTLPAGTPKARGAKLRSGTTSRRWLADGRQVVSGGYDGKLVIQDATEGTVVREISALKQAVTSIAVSDDGTIIAAGGQNGGVSVSSVTDGTSKVALEASRSVGVIAFTPDGQRLLTGDTNGAIVLWDLPKASFVRYLVDPLLSSKDSPLTVRAHRGSIRAVAISSDGATLASASDDKTAKVWSLPTGQLIGQFKGHTEAVGAVAVLAGDRTFVTSSGDKSTIGWSVPSAPASPPPTRTPPKKPPKSPAVAVEGQARFAIKKHTLPVSSMAVSPDGRIIATGAQDKNVFLSSATDGSAVGVLQGFDRGIDALAFSPDSALLCVTSADNSARLWVTAEQRLFAALVGQSATREIAWSPDGKTIATGRDNGSVDIWSAADARLVNRYTPQSRSSAITAIRFTHDGTRLVAATTDGSVLVLTASDAKLVAIREVDTTRITSIALTKDDRTLFSAGTGRSVRVWELPELRHVTSFDGHSLQVTAMALTPDNKWLVTGDYLGVLALWDLTARKLHSYLFDAAATDSTAKARSYDVFDKVTGQTVTYTLPCGTPMPANATCICNCVTGTASVPRPSGGGGGGFGGSICRCNRVCTCVPIFQD